MFGRMMNNYYYGKSGKGDFRKEDLPETRSQLFKDTLRTRLSALCRINLLCMLVWLPAMIVIFVCYGNIYTDLGTYDMIKNENFAYYEEQVKGYGGEVRVTEEEYNRLKEEDVDLASYAYSSIFYMLLYLFPCIAITGPCTAGLSYVTRNWARDEHAFIWTDFKDAVKKNWKIPLVISTVTGLLPLAAYEGWIFYGQMASKNMIMLVPQIIVPMFGAVWAISVTYMHPLTVTYDLKLKDDIRNGLILGVARLPFSVGIRLLHCVPLAVYFVATSIFRLDPMFGLVIHGAYYMLIGFALSRFVTASYTNAVFDRFINSRMENVKVNQGMRETADDDDDDDDDADGTGEGGKE